MKAKRYQLHRWGNLLLLHAAIGGAPNIPPLPITLIIDTGAAYTILDPDILKAVGCDIAHPLQEVRILTVNGMVTAPIVTVPWLHCLGRKLLQWKVIAHPLPDEFKQKGYGLLGMDFLTRFGAVIHLGRGEIWLEGETEETSDIVLLDK